MATDIYDYNDEDIESDDGGQLLQGKYNEKTSAASFQQALLQWRQGGGKQNIPQTNRSKKSHLSTHEAAVDTVHDSNGRLNELLIPNIEFHSSNLTYGEKLLLKKYRRVNHQEFFNQRIPSTNNTAREQANKTENDIHVNRSLPENISLKDSNLEIEVGINRFFERTS